MPEVHIDNQETPEVPEVEQGQETPQPSPSEDLLTRVSKFVADKDPAKETQDKAGDGLDSKRLEESIAAIEDPDMRSKMEGLRKSLLSGATNKFQEIAELRKEMQSFMETNKSHPEQWTPERVRALANDPMFVEAAQQLAGTSEETDAYSNLSSEEKARLKEMNDEIENLKRINAQAMKTQQQQFRNQQHEQLRGKYANYDPSEIDQITFDMLQNKIQATPEHIYKAFKHDDNVRRAYELGRKDERDGVTEKLASSSASGISTNPSKGTVEPEDGESSQKFFERIIHSKLSAMKHKS